MADLWCAGEQRIIDMENGDTSRDPRSTTLTDKTIGARIRARRTELQLSQERLAEMIGVTFQQIQKYEKGVNRVSAAALLSIARALDVEVMALYPPDALFGGAGTLHVIAPEFYELAKLAQLLNDDGQRLLLKLAQALASQSNLKKGTVGNFV